MTVNDDGIADLSAHISTMSPVHAKRFLVALTYLFLKTLFSDPFVGIGIGLLLLSLFSYFVTYFSHAVVTVVCIVVGGAVLVKGIGFNSVEKLLSTLSVRNLKNVILVVSVLPSIVNGLSLAFLSTYVASHHVAVVVLYSALSLVAFAYSRLRHESQFLTLRLQLIAFLHLYALSLSLLNFDRLNFFKIGAPIFLVVSARVLSLTPPDLFQETLRTSLRRVVAETLQDLGEELQKDEVLMVAMGRWLVDYWATVNGGREESSGAGDTGGSVGSNGDFGGEEMFGMLRETMGIMGEESVSASTAPQPQLQ